MNSQEVWKAVPEYEQYYAVSSYGRVRSNDRVVILKNGATSTKKGRLLKPNKDKYGYLVVTLYNKKIAKTFKIHRLVALAFIDNPNCFPVINHKDEDRANNYVENLEWCSAEYNNNYGNRNKRISISRTGQDVGRKLSEETKRKMSIAHSKPSGRIVSEETRKKIAESLRVYNRKRKDGLHEQRDVESY